MQHLDTGSEIENAARLDKVVNGHPVFTLIKAGKYTDVRKAFPRDRMKTLAPSTDTPVPYVTLAEQLSVSEFDSHVPVMGERTKPVRKLAWERPNRLWLHWTTD